MNTGETTDNRPLSSATGEEAGDSAEMEPFRWMHWVRRALPLAFLALVSVLAVHELRGLDIHAVRQALQALSLPQLLIVAHRRDGRLRHDRV